MLNFLNKPIKGVLPRQREKMWKKIEPKLQTIRNDVYENQLLKLFDFTAWMESIVCKIPLQEVLGCRFQ
jgi:hypothetical protein